MFWSRALVLVPLGAITASLTAIQPPDASAPRRPAMASIDSSLLRSYRWRNIGPDRGGRSIAVSGVRGRPREAYFGAVGGGLWKTLNPH